MVIPLSLVGGVSLYLVFPGGPPSLSGGGLAPAVAGGWAQALQGWGSQSSDAASVILGLSLLQGGWEPSPLQCGWLYGLFYYRVVVGWCTAIPLLSLFVPTVLGYLALFPGLNRRSPTRLSPVAHIPAGLVYLVRVRRTPGR